MRACALLILLWSTSAHAFLYFPFHHDVGRSRGFSGAHGAIDFASACGTRVYAAAAGRVSRVIDRNGCRRCYACAQGCGNAYIGGPCQNNEIRVDHGNGFQTRYVHLQQGSATVAAGDRVQAGQLIGRSGNVGWTCGNTGCHLHFELWNPQGNRVDPDGRWLRPRRYGGDVGPPPDETAPACRFPDETPPTRAVLTDPAERLRWRVTDDGGSQLAGASQSWDAAIPRNSEPEFDFSGRDGANGHLELGWAGVGRHTAYIRAWDGAGNTCWASSGPYWFFPVPFERSFLVSDALATEGGERERIDETPLGDEADLRPMPGDPGWRAHEAEGPFVDLDALLGGDDRVAYAMTWCYNAGPEVELDARFGTDDGFRMWVNGERVAEGAEPRGAVPDEDTVRVRMRGGYNPVLLKVEEKRGGWGFYLRFSQPDAPDQATELTCLADFTSGPCAADDECPGDYVCDGNCQPAPPPGPDAGPPPAVDAAVSDAAVSDAAADLDPPSPDVVGDAQVADALDAALSADGGDATVESEGHLSAGCRQSPRGEAAGLLFLLLVVRRRSQ